MMMIITSSVFIAVLRLFRGFLGALPTLTPFVLRGDAPLPRDGVPLLRFDVLLLRFGTALLLRFVSLEFVLLLRPLLLFPLISLIPNIFTY